MIECDQISKEQWSVCVVELYICLTLRQERQEIFGVAHMRDEKSKNCGE